MGGRQMHYEDLARKILRYVGGSENITSFTNCMTRLRVNVKDTTKVATREIEQSPGVLGVIVGDQTQVIVGPGHASRLCAAFAYIAGAPSSATVEPNDVAAEKKKAVKDQHTSRVQSILKQIGNIFVPLIPGFVATGIVAAIANVIRTLQPEVSHNPWFVLFASCGTLLVGVLNVLAGYNAAKEFGGTAVIGAIMGALIGLPALAGIAANTTGQVAQPLAFVVPIINYTIKLAPNLGGVIGVIFSAYLCTAIEKQLRQVISPTLDLFIVPFATMMVGGMVTIFIVMPLAALMMSGLIYILLDVFLKQLGVLGGYLLAATFLPMVMLGVHQAFTPVHAELIVSEGYTVLLPIMAMAGAGQVGAALAIFVKTKDKKLKATAASGIPVGILGVGEPLIYGLSLPLFYPFITACLGAGFGGAIIALGNLLSPVGAIAIGPSGALLVALIANGQWLWYVGGLCAAYAGGFILTYFFGYNDDMLQRLR